MILTKRDFVTLSKTIHIYDLENRINKLFIFIIIILCFKTFRNLSRKI